MERSKDVRFPAASADSGTSAEWRIFKPYARIDQVQFFKPE
jgi:hypothetical protein